jgi:hypothetical protein
MHEKKQTNSSERKHTCGVGEGGAASTGERVVALLASL